MLTPDQVSTVHRLHRVEKWSARKIASHLRVGSRTIAKYLDVLAPRKRSASAPANSIRSKQPLRTCCIHAAIVVSSAEPRVGHVGGLFGNTASISCNTIGGQYS